MFSAEAVKITTFKKGDAIVNYGDAGEMFYMIKSGSVVCLVPSKDGAGRRGEFCLLFYFILFYSLLLFYILNNLLQVNIIFIRTDIY